MDPIDIRRRREQHRLPRSRGDGPWTASTNTRTRTVAPLARGWTLETNWAAAPHCGCPARAGMDPAQETEVIEVYRLPRSRGDGPHSDDWLGAS